MTRASARWWSALQASILSGALAGCTTNGGMVPGPSPKPTASPRTEAAGSRPPDAGSFQVLHRFSGRSDGDQPDSSLISVNGTLYGTTSRGARSDGCAPGGCGAVYGISTTGVVTPLHDFKGNYDGANPVDALIAVNGKLYGTTVAGGGHPCTLGGCGTVFSVSTNGKEHVLYRFTGGSDGAYPEAGLIDLSGTLYGTASTGGSLGNGTVFSVSTSGSEKTLYQFAGGADGADPEASLIDVGGTLYGTTIGGGGSSCAGGCGTVYSISTSGAEKILYRFAGGSDGAYPEAGLIDVNGTLYGTTITGGGTGCGGGCGTVFSVSTSGTETVVYRFKRVSGWEPESSLIESNGILYGTTADGGVSHCGDRCGTVYSISTTGVERVLHRFSRHADGFLPQAGLIDRKGVLYGTTTVGGSRCSPFFSCGIVFALSRTGADWKR